MKAAIHSDQKLLGLLRKQYLRSTASINRIRSGLIRIRKNQNRDKLFPFWKLKKKSLFFFALLLRLPPCSFAVGRYLKNIHAQNLYLFIWKSWIRAGPSVVARTYAISERLITCGEESLWYSCAFCSFRYDKCPRWESEKHCFADRTLAKSKIEMKLDMPLWAFILSC